MHIISVACLGFLTLYFLVDSFAQRTMVETMKMVANAAREAIAMRHCFFTLQVEQGWTSVLGGLFGTSQGVDVVGKVDLVVGIGRLLVPRGTKIPAVLEEIAAVVEMAESVENEVVGSSAVELDPAVSANCDVEMWLLVTETGRCVDESSVLVVDVSLTVTGKEVESEVGFAVIVVVVEADGLVKFWMKTGA